MSIVSVLWRDFIVLPAAAADANNIIDQRLHGIWRQVTIDTADL